MEVSACEQLVKKPFVLVNVIAGKLGASQTEIVAVGMSNSFKHQWNV